jgi:putative phosphoribosyl transferase
MEAIIQFQDRHEAGRVLADRLMRFAEEETVVFGLPRGGVVVAYEIARALHAPLAAYAARKLGAPGHPEYGIGAIAPGGVAVVDESAVAALGITESEIEEVKKRELEELERRSALYGSEGLSTDLAGRVAIVVDDGLATGVTARAALRSLRRRNPGRLVFAAPVCAPASLTSMEGEADEVVCVSAPEGFRAVGQWYADFSQTEDDEVLELLERARWELQAGKAR